MSKTFTASVLGLLKTIDEVAPKKDTEFDTIRRLRFLMQAMEGASEQYAKVVKYNEILADVSENL